MKALTPEDVAAWHEEQAQIAEGLRNASRSLDTGYKPFSPPAKTKLVNVPIPDVPVKVLKDTMFGRLDKRIANKTYVIRSGAFVKIGIAVDIEARFRTLLSSNPHDLECLVVFPGGRPVERALHQRFAAHRHRDEWFRVEGSLAEWIDAGCPYDP